MKWTSRGAAQRWWRSRWSRRRWPPAGGSRLAARLAAGPDSLGSGLGLPRQGAPPPPGVPPETGLYTLSACVTRQTRHLPGNPRASRG
jgi:hypothetical protein